MRILKSIASVMVFASLAGFIGCDHDENPCDGLNPVSADFKIMQTVVDDKSLFVVDTVLLRYYRGVHFSEAIYFSALEENATYQWKVGDDARVFTEQQFYLEFNEPYGKLDVQLIVQKTPNVDCFPTDDGVDTLMLSVAILSDKDLDYKFEGTFRGVNTDTPAEIFDITIVDFGPTPVDDPYDPSYYDMRLFNIPQGCGGGQITPARYAPELNAWTYKRFSLYQTSNTMAGDCFEIDRGQGEVSDDGNIIRIDYDIRENGEFKKKTFTGNRVQ